MAADLGYVYDLRTNHVFLKHKCNFRLDLMYYKSLLNNREQLHTTRAWDLGASASTMSAADLEAAANHIKIVLPASLLSFNLVLKSNSIGIVMLFGVKSC